MGILLGFGNHSEVLTPDAAGAACRAPQLTCGLVNDVVRHGTGAEQHGVIGFENLPVELLHGQGSRPYGYMGEIPLRVVVAAEKDVSRA